MKVLMIERSNVEEANVLLLSGGLELVADGLRRVATRQAYPMALARTHPCVRASRNPAKYRRAASPVWPGDSRRAKGLRAGIASARRASPDSRGSAGRCRAG